MRKERGGKREQKREFTGAERIAARIIPFRLVRKH